MRIAGVTVLYCLALLLSNMPCRAQTAQDINNLLKKSKLVDIGREVNTRLGSDDMTISTYAHPKASDQDVKITALFMMKEIRQHYKNILRAQVLFYDPSNSSQYREVEVREGDVALVDAGKPIKEVLAQISVRSSRLPQKNASARSAKTVDGAQPRTSLPVSGQLASTVNSLLPGLLSSTDELAYFQTPDGKLQIKAPKTWAQDASGITGHLITFATLRNGSAVTLNCGCLPPTNQSLEELADMHVEDVRQKFHTVRVLIRRKQSCAGVPAIYVMGSSPLPLGRASAVERDLILRKNNRVYYVLMNSTDTNDQGLEGLFQTIADSIVIR